MDTYEEKYNEALEKAKYYHDRDNIQFLENIFPELKESEDERIRKKLIEAVKGDMVVGGTKDKQLAIAWLEKQGEHANFRNKIQIGDKVTRNEGGVLVNISQLSRVAKEHKKQGGEQIPANSVKTCKVDNANKVEPKDYNDIDPHFGKPIDKVVPKFKVGDWIIFNGLTLYIKEIVKGYYRTISKGGITNSYDWGIDNTARLWSITDAKDGDVLATSAGAFIYNGNNGGGSCPGCYCGIDTLGSFKTGVEHHWTGKKVYPATEEQRDTLFAKMKEAGYVWLSGKKRLVKLLFKEGDTVRKKLDGSIWHINYINEHGYWGNHKPLFPIENQNEFELFEQKPAWSEEDEHYLYGIIGLIENSKAGVEVNIKGKAADNCINWLKSLKPQTTWKPSEEQLKVLDEVIKNPHLSATEYNILTEIEEQLKKLREE